MNIRKKGFTLIELLVVVAIIGILAAVGVVAYNGYTKSAKIGATKNQHASIKNFIEASYAQCALGNDYIKNRISDFKSLSQSNRWPLYLLLFGVWDLMIGFAYLLFSYFEISQVTMIVANALFITGTYLTFLSFSVAKKLQLSKKN